VLKASGKKLTEFDDDVLMGNDISNYDTKLSDYHMYQLAAFRSKNSGKEMRDAISGSGAATTCDNRETNLES
jgi:hypothetical protein